MHSDVFLFNFLLLANTNLIPFVDEVHLYVIFVLLLFALPPEGSPIDEDLR